MFTNLLFVTRPATTSANTRDATGVAAVDFIDGAVDTVFVLRHGDQQDMVKHQTPDPDLDPALSAPRGNQAKAVPVVVVAEEGQVTMVAALDDVMGAAGEDYAGDSDYVSRI